MRMTVRRALGLAVRSTLTVALGVALIPASAAMAAGEGTSAGESAVAPVFPGVAQIDVSGFDLSGFELGGPDLGSIEGSNTGSASIGSTGALSISNDLPYADGEVIVKFTSDVVGTVAIDAANAELGALRTRTFDLVPGLEVAKLPSGMSVEVAVKAYEAMPNVEYAQPNYRRRVLASMPNDVMSGTQWGLNNTGQTAGVSDADIDAPEAWDFTAGSSSALVAVIDTGVDYNHSDLSGNMWVNADEVPGNGIDDDLNGYTDDVHGYDFCNRDANPMDDYGHGTHVAGTIGALGNNSFGTAGVCWDVSLVAIKAVSANGTMLTSDAIEAIQYADAIGAQVCNCSWGSSESADAALYDAMAASDMLFVCAAGNDATDTDVTPFYPASFDLDNVLSVGASTDSDTAAAFSNYGSTSVDVFAPGEDVVSTCLPAAGWTVPNTVIWFDPFSGSESNWYSGGVRWVPMFSRAFSVPSCKAALDYWNNDECWLISERPVNLAGSTHPFMSFRMGIDMEYDHDGLLFGMYDLSADRATIVAGWTGTSANTWDHYAVDVSAFAGQSDVYPFFIETADAATDYHAGFEGVWIDDLTFTRTACTYGVGYSNAYVSASGTSMAAAHASGAAALLLSRDPAKTAGELKSTIMSTSNPLASLSGKCVTGGRVNLHRAVLSVNRLPVAVGDTFEGIIACGTAPWTAPAGSLLANDYDPDGDGVTAVRTRDAAHGNVTVRTDGSFTYTPAWGFSGTDSFTYAVRDASGANSNEATVYVTVTEGAVIDDQAVGVTFDRFVPCTSSAYSGGTYVYGRWSGTALEMRFKGTKVVWIGARQPSYGKADVYIDGVKKATVDCYAPAGSATLSTTLWESDTLSVSTHTISIRLTGAKNPASTGNVVVVDRFDIFGTSVEPYGRRVNESAASFTGNWVSCTNPTYTDGTYRYSSWANRSVAYTFDGTQVAWIGPRAPFYGRAAVYIDGTYKATVSQYGPLGWRYRVWESQVMNPGIHTIQIRCLGTKDPVSTGTPIVVDGFEVRR